MQRQYDYILKIVMVGSSAVGKTSVIKRFADNQFNPFYISTIGIDFRFKSIPVNNYYVKLQLWDTAGQERFKGITKSYYTNADAVIIIYDVSDNPSFEDIKSFWLNEVKSYCKNEVRIFVLCNKCDLPEQTIKQAHKKFFNQNQIEYFMVSAKTGRGVQAAIMQITKKMIKVVPKIQEKGLSMQLRETHFEGRMIKKQNEKKCC